jgi:hypothetical protein
VTLCKTGGGTHTNSNDGTETLVLRIYYIIPLRLQGQEKAFLEEHVYN